MDDSTVWKSVAVRLTLLNALKAEYEKTKSSEDKPTRVVDKLIRGYLEGKGIKLDTG